jgi:hypothetical protein
MVLAWEEVVDVGWAVEVAVWGRQVSACVQVVEPPFPTGEAFHA